MDRVDLIERSALPLACELGPDDGRARLLRWQRLHETGAPVARLDGGRLEVRYRHRPGVEQELRQLATAEQECCAFLRWEVSALPGHLVLHVTAPAGAPEAVEPVAALFGVSAAAEGLPEPRKARRG